jgi:transposase-like protein
MVKFGIRNNVQRYQCKVCKRTKSDVPENPLINLSIRLFNRRLTRLTLGFSKKLANLKYSMALFIAHYNFCRVHSAHKQTPAMAAELTNHVWPIEELLRG